MKKETLIDQAYAFAYPMLLMEMTKRVMTNTDRVIGFRAPVNTLCHSEALANASNHEVVSPNVDTLYSQAFLDLSRGPLIFKKPAANRYCTVAFLDAWTNCPYILGTGAIDGNAPGSYMIAGPGDTVTKAPPGMTLLKMPTNTVWLLIRTVLYSPDDLDNVRDIQKAFNLSVIDPLQKIKGRVNLADTFVPVDRVNRMDISEYFNTFNQLLESNPPYPEDSAFLEQIRPLGIGAGLTFDLSDFTDEEAAAICDTNTRVIKDLLSRSADYTHNVNNWSFFKDSMAAFGTDYSYRAYVALTGFGANPESMAVYPFGRADQNNDPLSGGHSYTLHFEKGSLPPCRQDGFWSITLYSKNNFLADNAINRYCINDRSGLVPNADGSYDIFIQKEPPSATANWLPATEGEFHLIMRIYLPAPQVLDGSWKPPYIFKK